MSPLDISLNLAVSPLTGMLVGLLLWSIVAAVALLVINWSTSSG